jgi:adenylyltransferase/sulfurtransferase
MQVAEAMKWIVGAARETQLTTYDVWTNAFHRMDLGTEVMKTCPVCAEARYEYLNGSPLRTVTLCGRNAVQLIPGVKGDMDFQKLSKAFPAADVQFNDFLMKCSSPPYELTLFKDGRAIVKGTEEAAMARSVYSKIVGV